MYTTILTILLYPHSTFQNVQIQIGLSTIFFVNTKQMKKTWFLFESKKFILEKKLLENINNVFFIIKVKSATTR